MAHIQKFVRNAMNTIPLTFNEKQIQRTVLGGEVTPTQVKLPISVILLSRSGSTFRITNLETLLNFGFSQIISIESSSKNYSLEDLSRKYPSVKFIMPHEQITTGEMINIGMSETTMNYVLVLWDTLKITPRLLAERLITKLSDDNKFCYAPQLSTPQLQVLPVRMIPTVEKNTFTVTSEILIPDGSATLYPFDFSGIYNRNKFIQLGGYDYTICSPYWQNLDLSMRAWLWGEEIVMIPQVKLFYECEVPAEDTTADFSQLRFFLKNIAPKYTNDHTYIPKKHFLKYYRRSGCGLSEALRDFKDARSWVEKNRFRFVTDTTRLIQNWVR